MFLPVNTSLWTNILPENAEFLHKTITEKTDLSCKEGHELGMFPEWGYRGGWREPEGTGVIKPPAALTQALGQEVLDELGMISNVQHAVDAGVHQVLLLVPQILADIFWDKHYVALHVDHEKEAVQGLRSEAKESRQERNKEAESKEHRKKCVDNSGMVFGELGRKGGKEEEELQIQKKFTRGIEREDWEVIKVHFNFQVKAH